MDFLVREILTDREKTLFNWENELARSADVTGQSLRATAWPWSIPGRTFPSPRCRALATFLRISKSSFFLESWASFALKIWLLERCQSGVCP